ncbi:13735_t:CDS:2 [Ambispora leptoticha]|uniref:13735_t:CDS:1 n=1 Tax=Ambispora leptoticha TaxID=144679 RepID=A0A9N9HF67_9GLOM|nr:13735_t:CDS:2 [Ambispora leptoticha]
MHLPKLSECSQNDNNKQQEQETIIINVDETKKSFEIKYPEFVCNEENKEEKQNTYVDVHNDEEKINDKSCRCSRCQHGLTPSLRSDLRGLEKYFHTVRLLREVALFTGTRNIADKVIDYFHSTWKNPFHMGKPVVTTISFAKCNENSAQKFDECLSEFTLIVDDPNVKPLWRGTRSQCEYEEQESPCDPSAVLCCNSCKSIYEDEIGKNRQSNDKRIYFSTNSSHCFTFSKFEENEINLSHSTTTATIQLCFVATGKPHTFDPALDNFEELFEAPPYPCHSVYRQKKDFGEFITYRWDGFIPFVNISYRMSQW